LDHSKRQQTLLKVNSRLVKSRWKLSMSQSLYSAIVGCLALTGVDQRLHLIGKGSHRRWWRASEASLAMTLECLEAASAKASKIRPHIRLLSVITGSSSLKKRSLSACDSSRWTRTITQIIRQLSLQDLKPSGQGKVVTMLGVS